jgi:hypothetical protein
MPIGIKCEKCKMEALIFPTAKDRYEAPPPTDFINRCPEIRAKLDNGGSLTGAEITCPHLERAAGLAFDRWQRGQP